MPFVYYVMLSEAVGEVETSPGRVPCEMGAEHGSCTHYKNGRRIETDYVGAVEELPYVRSRARSLHFGHCVLW